MNSYQNEQDIYFNYLFKNLFLNNLNSYKSNTIFDIVELIITPECNLACEYCYLYNHGEKLYPSEIRNKEMIITNLNSLLDYFEENNFIIPKLMLFSGEIWSSDFGISILETLLERYKKYKFSSVIGIPSNMSFLLNDLATQKIQKIMDDFKQLEIKILWSASVEGKVIEDKFRPFKDINKKHDENFYDKLFIFAQKNNIGFHPMIYSKSCKYWIENYKWYIEQFEKYKIPRTDPMMLEIRNDNWDDEDIEYLLKFLDFLLDFKFKYVHGNMKNFINEVFHLFGKAKSYSPIEIHGYDNRMTCSIQNSIHIRLGDLAIVPCHRTSYKENIYGFFIKNQFNKIEKIISNNCELASFIWCFNPNIAHPHCDTCEYKILCTKGCLGAQYESSGDLFLPCQSVCNMKKKKIDFLLKKYEEYGIFKFLEEESCTNKEVSILYNSLIEGKNKIESNRKN